MFDETLFLASGLAFLRDGDCLDDRRPFSSLRIFNRYEPSSLGVASNFASRNLSLSHIDLLV